VTAYYNEYDPFAAAWLRELIKAGHIAPGDVDERSIKDVQADDLQGYTQCHFFAGIGVWSLALRAAGWSDQRPVWTGSCPCQPFSAAGKGGGFDDARHLWPDFFRLIAERRPDVVLGEQVASKDGLAWLDLVHSDLEGANYAVGAVDTCAAGFGAPHIRQRLYWAGQREGVGHADDTRLEIGRRGPDELVGAQGRQAAQRPVGLSGVGGGLAEPHDAERRPDLPGRDERDGADAGRPQGTGHVGAGGGSGGLADADGRDASAERQQRGGQQRQQPQDGLAGDRVANDTGCGRREERADGRGVAAGDRAQRLAAGSVDGGGDSCPGPTNGLWRDVDWLGCRDGKWRPVSASPQPVAYGSAESLGRVRDASAQACEEEINGVLEIPGNETALRDLWCDLVAQTASEGWPLGRVPGLCEAPFLLAFLRQLAEQRRGISERLSLPRAETSQGGVRGVWADDGTARAPRQRGLDGQSSGEHSDPVRLLSSILARAAQEAWALDHKAYAEAYFPLAVGSENRVGRLRGYGNAINLAQAQGFIEAVM